MNKIKFILIVTKMLLFSACAFLDNAPQTYAGTINMVKQKDVSGFVMGALDYRTYSYKLEITTSEGIILKGEYEDVANKYKPGDFVKVIVIENKIKNLEILDRSTMDSHF